MEEAGHSGRASLSSRVLCALAAAFTAFTTAANGTSCSSTAANLSVARLVRLISRSPKRSSLEYVWKSFSGIVARNIAQAGGGLAKGPVHDQ